MNAAAGLVEVRVPDMGNFKDVAIIDVLVKPGEKIEPEAPLVTLETEKATMDVPSTVGGVVEQIHISKGGTVSTGDLIVTVRSEGASASTTEAAGAPQDAQGGSGAPKAAASPGAAGQSGDGQAAPGPSGGAAGPSGGTASPSTAPSSRAAATQPSGAPGQPASRPSPPTAAGASDQPPVASARSPEVATGQASGSR